MGTTKRLTVFAVSLLFSLLHTGCVSMMERAGRVLDGSAFAERVQAVYRTPAGDDGLEIRIMRARDGEYSLLILPERFPSVQIRTSAPNADGEFILVSLDYLGGNEHGWNEFRLDLFGSGRFDRTRFSVSPGFEPVQISLGRIRRYDTRITGSDALTYLRNRHERILALTEWMHEQEGRPQDMGTCRGSFERHWGPILFPELARRRDRPRDWLLEGDVRVRAENVGWNTGYTERVFPELLWNVRNSGTLLRDWEEALEWIHLKYGWGGLVERLTRETVLIRAGR